MARIDMMFYDDGEGCSAFGLTLEEDRREEKAGGGDRDIVAHIIVEECDDSFREVMARSFYAMIDAVECICPEVFDRFITEIFRAGRAHGLRLAARGDND